MPDRTDELEHAILGTPEIAGRGDGSGYEVRCPHCHALQFLARERWESVAIDEATVAIKCWRRTCKVVLGLRPAGAICPQTPESGQEVRV